MRGQNHADRDLLRGRYKGLADGDLVAYVDESYRLPTDCRPHETPFYAMSAVLLRVCDLDTIRDDLRTLARSNYPSSRLNFTRTISESTTPYPNWIT